MNSSRQQPCYQTFLFRPSLLPLIVPQFFLFFDISSFLSLLSSFYVNFVPSFLFLPSFLCLYPPVSLRLFPSILICILSLFPLIFLAFIFNVHLFFFPLISRMCRSSFISETLHYFLLFLLFPLRNLSFVPVSCQASSLVEEYYFASRPAFCSSFTINITIFISCQFCLEELRSPR